MDRKYRVTRPKLYGPGSIGYSDVSARNGHYLTGQTVDGVLDEMNKRYPDDAFNFTIQSWEGQNMGAVLFDGSGRIERQ